MPRLTAIFIIVLTATTCFAKAAVTPRPFPQSVLEAKTIYIENETTDTALTNKAAAELSSWGRFEIVREQSRADITLTISTPVNLHAVNDDDHLDITVQLLLPHDDIPQFSYTQNSVPSYLDLDVVNSIKVLRKRIDQQERLQKRATEREKIAIAGQ